MCEMIEYDRAGWLGLLPVDELTLLRDIVYMAAYATEYGTLAPAHDAMRQAVLEEYNGRTRI